MKIVFILTFLTLSSCALAQEDTDPTEIFKAHQFPCDTGTSTLEINICLGTKLEFADSLLNVTYHKILKDLDSTINEDRINLKALRLKKTFSDEERSDLKYYTSEVNRHQNTKQAIIASQRQWVRLRDSNEEVVRIICEGGTGCYGEVSQSSIDDTIDRIKKLQEFAY